MELERHPFVQKALPLTNASKDPLQGGTWSAGSVRGGETEAWRGLLEETSSRSSQK